MLRLNLLENGSSYTFDSYFEMPYEIDEILAEFGVSYSLQNVFLPKADVAPEVAAMLRVRIERNLKVVLLSSETARRQILVAPVLTQVASLSKSKLRIEYSLVVDDQLQGKLNYLMLGKHRLVVVAAKQNDFYRGFTQLAVELIALSRIEKAQKVIYGAVTVGDVWSFGCIDSEEQQVMQHTSRYRVPEDLEDVLEILTGILTAD